VIELTQKPPKFDGSRDQELKNCICARMMEISDNRGYNYIAGFHGVPGWYCWHHQRNTHLVQLNDVNMEPNIKPLIDFLIRHSKK